MFNGRRLSTNLFIYLPTFHFAQFTVHCSVDDKEMDCTYIGTYLALTINLGISDILIRNYDKAGNRELNQFPCWPWRRGGVSIRPLLYYLRVGDSSVLSAMG